MRELAQKLIANSQSHSGAREGAPVLLNERLCLSLIRFAGADGFASLLRRALTLASTKIPALRSATVGMECRIEGLDPAFTRDHVLRQQAAIVVTAHLLELLVIFIGESITRRMVQEACREPSSRE